MYAIVKTGGKQYRVERGQRLLIERLRADAGAEVALQPLLCRSDETVLDKAGLEQVRVTAKVLEHVRGPKLRVFKFKPKRGYRRRTGHRQELTRIEVTDIAAGKRRAAKAKPDGDGEPAKAKPKPTRAKAAGGDSEPAKKPARPAGTKPAGTKPAGAKPTGAKPAGAKPTGAKPAGTKAPRPAKPRKDQDGS